MLHRVPKVGDRLQAIRNSDGVTSGKVYEVIGLTFTGVPRYINDKGRRAELWQWDFRKFNFAKCPINIHINILCK